MTSIPANYLSTIGLCGEFMGNNEMGRLVSLEYKCIVLSNSTSNSSMRMENTHRLLLLNKDIFGLYIFI